MDINYYSNIVISCIKAIEEYIETLDVGPELDNIYNFLEDIKQNDERLYTDK